VKDQCVVLRPRSSAGEQANNASSSKQPRRRCLSLEQTRVMMHAYLRASIDRSSDDAGAKEQQTFNPSTPGINVSYFLFHLVLFFHLTCTVFLFSIVSSLHLHSPTRRGHHRVVEREKGNMCVIASSRSRSFPSTRPTITCHTDHTHPHRLPFHHDFKRALAPRSISSSEETSTLLIYLLLPLRFLLYRSAECRDN